MAFACNCTKQLLAILRLSMGWIMLWSFLDKLFGLGFDVSSGQAWLDRVSPTEGFLLYGTSGPFATTFQALAGQPWVDWLFMAGLLLIGLSMILGVGLRVSGYSGALLMLLMWLATLFPEYNPLMDEHLVYAVVFLLLPSTKAGHTWGLGTWWEKRSFVQAHPWLI